MPCSLQGENDQYDAGNILPFIPLTTTRDHFLGAAKTLNNEQIYLKEIRETTNGLVVVCNNVFAHNLKYQKCMQALDGPDVKRDLSCHVARKRY